MFKFLVVSPQPKYIEYIGGVTVAHTLAYQLQLSGQQVELYADSTHPSYPLRCIPHGTIVNCDTSDIPTIVILIAGAGDHTFLGNIPSSITNSKYVVRWQVNHQTREYPEHNKFYKYHKYWNTFETQKIDGYLSVIDINKNIYFDYKQPRRGNCYLIKGNLDTELERIMHNKYDICIDQYLHNHNIPDIEKKQLLANIFNKSEVFISYTPLTFASVLASLCGCLSVVIPKSNFDTKKWRSEIWCAKYGTAVGIEDIQWSVETLSLVPSMVDEYLTTTQPQQIQQFIKDCHIWTNN